MTTATPLHTTCSPAGRVTRSLLGYGVLAGPLYVTVSLAQAFTRDGFDPSRHEWSLLADGGLGWIQSTNLALAGVMSVAFAVGLGRALPGTRWAARLVGGYGLGLVGAGAFRADPALGFPPGTPGGQPSHVSWHGMLHLGFGAVGFTCIAIACLLVGARWGRDGRPGWARFSQVTGVVFLLGFGAVAAGAGAVWANLFFTATVILVWAWMCAVAVTLYRTTR
jgi:hypothetical protein